MHGTSHRHRAIILAVVLIAVGALPGPAKSAERRQMTQSHKIASRHSANGNGEGRQHCGQRSFSISVGNPAFTDRVALWPRPCGW
jgi:hypothetical protein